MYFYSNCCFSFRIIGVNCLITCINNKEVIPPSPYPIFTQAMKNFRITTSGFDAEKKKELEEKIQYMGGYYDKSLRSIVTHLVAHNNISSKAIHAYKNNIKIMKISWIEDVWKQNLVKYVNGDDIMFSEHLSPLFHNLKITTSGISKKEKDILKKVIESNGGNFMGILEANVTNILLVTKPEGEKFRVAQNWNVVCLRPDWIQDCVNTKTILPLKSYLIENIKPKSSTPNGKNSGLSFSANFTENLSVIRNVELSKQVNVLEETSSLATQKNGFQTPKKNKIVDQSKTVSKPDTIVKHSHSHTINNVLFKNFKDAGLFLDGISIYLYGFLPNECEKLKKILNKGGAIRFDEMSEAVTHVISGKSYDSVLASYAKAGAYILSIDWLVESMKLKGKANESKFLLSNHASTAPEPPSPMSKQGAQLLSQNEERPAPVSTLNLSDNEMEKLSSQLDELLHRYNSSQPGDPLDKPNPSAVCGPSNNLTITNKPQSSLARTLDLCEDDFFSGLSFFLSNDLSEEELQYLEELITERKGKIVGKRDFGVPDYAVVPLVGATLPQITAKEVVNVYFIKDCCVEGCLLSPRYYHQPVSCVQNAAPLKDCVVCVSNYVQGEREFMEMMIEILGGVAQSLLARKPKQGALKSTHLVCAKPQGQKYEGAVRWGLPVVHHDWLLKCATLGIRVSEKPYLIGDSKMPTSLDSKKTLEKTPGHNNTTNTAGIESSKITVTDSIRAADKTQKQITQQTNQNEFTNSTPVHSAIARVKATETPKNGNSPDVNRTVTPTSPYGAFYGKGTPTPKTRKRLWKWMNQGAEFPIDPPSKPFPQDDSTPMSELISRHLEMLKRKPEELPPDSPTETPFKRLNLDTSENENSNKSSVNTGLKKMRQIEEKITKNDVKSPCSLRKGNDGDEQHMVVVTESQAHTEVGWEDPVEKGVFLETLEKAARIEKSPKVFMFSCLSDKLEDFKKSIEDCGGIVSSLPYFDKRATHLITGNLTRAEKLMGSVAAGLWVLHPSYVDALKEVGNVEDLSEEEYEWGSPKQMFRFNSLSANAKEYAQCSHMWRVSISQGHPPAFKNVKILLHVSQSKYDSFKRLIEAGSGTVVYGDPPEYQGVNADVCVYEANNTEPISFLSLAQQNIPCVGLIYISDVLLKKEEAISKNLVPDFSQYWNPK